jgi:hypothetical protein
MEPEFDRLLDLAGAIADGDSIDWDALEAAARSAEERRRFRRLRAVAAVVRAHDSFRDRPPPD